MARYIAKPTEWLELPEKNGTLQNIDTGVIEVSSENVENTGLKLGSNQILAFSGTVYVRSVGNRDCVFTTVPFEALGGGGDKTSKTILWSGIAYKEGTEIELNDDLDKYDEIVVVMGSALDRTVYTSTTCIIGANPFLYVSWLNNNFSGGYVAKLDVSTYKNKIILVYSSRLDENIAIIDVYGIKYGGGEKK